MKILITGGAGCLGSNLLERYLLQGHDICVVDNFVTGKPEVVPSLAGLTVVKGSIADSGLVSNVFSEFRPTHVVHSAASYKNPKDWVEDVNTNVLGSINVAEAARKMDVVRFINLQTALCYGRPLEVPIPITHPSNPLTSYGISKAAGEAYLLQSDLPVVSLRLANICGPRLSIGPIPTFYRRLKAGQDCFCSDTVRDFMDMSDFFSLMDKALAIDSPVGVYNVSTGEGQSILDVYHVVCAYLGLTRRELDVIPVGEDDVREMILDPSKTENDFDWKARVRFREVIENQLRWYDEHGVSEIFSHLSQSEKLE